MRKSLRWDKNREIDLAAVNSRTNEILFGEVKWSNKPVGTNIYNDLKEKSKFIELGEKNRKEYFVLFSKSGFTPEMIRIAKNDNVYLFNKDKLMFIL